MRASMRSSREGSSKHNDRSFLRDMSEAEIADKAPHIDTDKTNYFWTCYKPITEAVHDGNATFDDAIMRYYEHHFRPELEARNARYIAQYHPERCKTIEQLVSGKLTKPEEMILQIGDKDKHVDAQTLWDCFIDLNNKIQQWNAQRPNCTQQIITAALHLDEATPHIHIQRVWSYKGDDGMDHLGQTETLKRAGYERPNPDKPASRYNNVKMSYDAWQRDRWYEIIKEHGIEIETEPRPRRKHLDKADYIAQQVQEKARQELERTQAQIRLHQADLARMASERAEMEKSTIEAQKALKSAQHELKQVQAEIEALERVVADRKGMDKVLKGLNQAIKNANTIGDRVAYEDLDLKKPMFGKDNEVSLGSVQSASWALGAELERLKPVVKALQDAEKKLTELTDHTEQHIEDRAQEIVRQTQEQLQRDARQAEKDRSEARQAKAHYDRLVRQAERRIQDAAEQLLEEFLTRQGFDQTKDGSERLADYCADIKLPDGRSVLDAFDDQEQERTERIRRAWGRGMTL